MTKNTKACEVFIVNEEKVDSAKKHIGKLSISEQIRYFKLFSDENRLKILYAIISEEELCVCDISEVIGATTATTSHHLQNLKKQNILDSRKEGKLSYYYLVDHAVIDLLHNDFKGLEG